MSTEANKQLVKKYFEAFSAGKVDDFLSMMSDDATWWVAGDFPLSGTKTKAEFGELLKTQLPTLAPQGIQIAPKSFTAEGDRVAVEAESQAHIANGKTYNNRYHFAVEVRDGKICAVREYLDTMHANDVLCEP